MNGGPRRRSNDMTQEQERTDNGNSFREDLADVQHEIWAHWMRYLFTQCVPDDHPGDLCIPARLVERWKRQTETPYEKLTEQERKSDREQADKVIAIMRKHALL